jgi:lambda repressor-like predicted transcriptional regulator
MDKPTAPTDWRTTLIAQGRTLRWLAVQTGKSPRTVYAYSRGDLVPPAEWLVAVSEAIGVDVTKGVAA